MTPEIPNILTFFEGNGLLLIFKVLILFLLLVFIIFNFIVVNRVSTLNKTFYLTAARASATIYLASVLLLFASISLFIITLVIV